MAVNKERPYTIIDSSVSLGAISSTVGTAPNVELARIEKAYSDKSTKVVVCNYSKSEFQKNLNNENLLRISSKCPDIINRIGTLMDTSTEINIDPQKYQTYALSYKKDAYIRVMVENLGPENCKVITRDIPLGNRLKKDCSNVVIEDLNSFKKTLK